MGLPIKVGNAGVQLAWTPNMIYRGSLACDPTTLAPNLSKNISISNDSYINFFPYIAGGKNSLRYCSGGYFHCKNSNDFHYQSIFSPAYIGESGSECYLTVTGSASQHELHMGSYSQTLYNYDTIFYEDQDEDNCFYSVTSKIGGYSTSIIKYRLQNSKLQTVYSVSISLGSGTVKITKIADGIVYVTGILYYTSSSKGYVQHYYYSINRQGVLTALSYDSPFYSSEYTTYSILPSQEINDYFYAFRNKVLVRFKKDMSYDSLTTLSINYSQSSSLLSRSEIIITTSKENNDEYISFVNRSNTFGEFLCYSKNGVLIQKFSNTLHFILVDNNNIITGNGNIISRLYWNETECKWCVLNKYTVGELYKYFTLDPSGTIWVHGKTQIHRILPGQGVKLNVEFEEDFYRWTGSNTDTSVYLQVFDQTNKPVTTKQEIELSGPIKFIDGTTVKTVSFDKANKISIPVTITGPGEINCSLKF